MLYSPNVFSYPWCAYEGEIAESVWWIKYGVLEKGCRKAEEVLISEWVKTTFLSKSDTQKGRVENVTWIGCSTDGISAVCSLQYAEFKMWVIRVQETTPSIFFYWPLFCTSLYLFSWCWQLLLDSFESRQLSTSPKSLSLMFSPSLHPSTFPGMLPVHLAGTATRHRPPAGCSGEGEGGRRWAGGPAVATTAPLAAAQQFATPPDGGQGRAVWGGGWGEERQRCGVDRGQLLLPHHRRIHRRQGNGGDGRGEFVVAHNCCFHRSDSIHFKLSSLHV